MEWTENCTILPIIKHDCYVCILPIYDMIMIFRRIEDIVIQSSENEK